MAFSGSTAYTASPHGAEIILDSQQSAPGESFRDTPLPFTGRDHRPQDASVPERLREMCRLYQYGRESSEARADNFYRQAVFMQDYEDDTPWSGSFDCYFPTYHDLSLPQLRGYFGWRTQVRRGVFHPIAASAAYLYLYEILNGIGTASPEDGLHKLSAFESGFLDSGIGDPRIRRNLRRWMLEYAVLNDLPPALTRQVADPAMLRADEALTALRNPEAYSDEEVFSALCVFAGEKQARSPVITLDPVRGMHLFSEVWRLSQIWRRQGKDLFTLCFGEQTTRGWYPLSNAVYCRKSRLQPREYRLSDCRSYRCNGGSWQVTSYEKLSFDLGRFQGFLHETDARLHRYLKTGHYLREKTADAWIIPWIEAVIEDDRKAEAEAAKPRITIDLSGLDRIRRDSDITRDRLLVETDREDPSETGKRGRSEAARTGSRTAAPSERIESGSAGKADREAADSPKDGLASEIWPSSEDGSAAEDTPAAWYAPSAEQASVAACTAGLEPALAELPLDDTHLRILRALLLGQGTSELIASAHLMPSVVADCINEALYDEIGDSVLLCEEDQLTLVGDYIEDLKQILGGSSHG